MRSIFTITKLTIREASRRKILWAALILGLLFLIIYGLGFHYARLDLVKSMQQRSGMNIVLLHEMVNFLLLAGLYSVNFMVIAMSALISVDTLSGEINSGTIQTLVTKPIQRWQIVIGKWMGFGLMLTFYLLLMAGGTMGVVYATSGYLAPHSTQGVALLWMNGMLFLSLSLWGGSFLSTLANGVVAFGLFGVAFVGGWMEQIGSFLGNQVAVNIGIISSLIFPCEAVWRRLVFNMQSPLVTRLGVSFFSSSSVPSQWMIVYAAAYAVVLLIIAMWRFNRRDL
ncbi:MAG: ABC transporter permease [Anaerolineaceae bacterium]|nr:MAG: ABC transporter permease [Anaerolineaceae bacterium]